MKLLYLRVVLILLMALTIRGVVVGAPGDTNWVFTTGEAVISSPALGEDGTLYFGSYDETFYAVNSDGTLKWDFALSSLRLDEFVYVFSSPAIGPSGAVYFGTEHLIGFGAKASGEIFSMSPETGVPDWSNEYFSLSWAAIYSDPAVGLDGTIYFGCYDTNLYALNSDGSEKWRFRPGDQIYSDVVIDGAGNLFFGCDDGKLYSLTPEGELRWEFQGGRGFTASPVIGPDATIYFGATWGTGGRTLYAVNPDGSEKWSFPTGGFVESSVAIDVDGNIYFGSNDSNVYSLRPDGTERWAFPTGGAVKSSPALTADETLYVGSSDTNLYVLTLEGQLIRRIPAGGEVFSSPVIADDGTVYVGDSLGLVYSIEGTSGLMDSAWPMFRGNPRHTGVSSVVPPSGIRIQSIELVAGVLTLTWRSETGAVYGVQSKGSLADPVWNEMGGDVTATGEVATWTGPIEAGDHEFFRIVLR